MTPSRMSQELPSRDPIVLAELVATGRLALEAIAGEPNDLDHFERLGLRDAVVALLRPAAEVAARNERLARLDPDVGIAVCLAGIDDPAAAVATLPFVSVVVREASPAGDGIELDGTTTHSAAQKRIVEDQPPEWSVTDGYLFVRGVDSDTIASALVATRPAG